MKTPVSTRTKTTRSSSPPAQPVTANTPPKGKAHGTSRRASTPPARSPEQQAADYIRSRIRTLETAADREALNLICTCGVFAIDDPSRITDAAGCLWSGRAAHQAKASRIDARIDAAGLTEAQRAIVGESQDLDTEHGCELADAAYLLGIAVGRRLGTLGLTALPEARARR